MISALKKETPINSSANRNLVSELRLIYRTTPEIVLYQQFQDLREKGIMLTPEYRDNIWVFRDHLKDIHWKLDFSGLHLASELKAFSILYLSENAPLTTNYVCNFIINALRKTKEFTSKNFSAEQIGYISPSAHQCFLNFLDFIEFNRADSRIYVECIATKVITNDSSRPLPSFQSVLIFEHLLNQFMENDLAQHPEYYPIVLWWKLTMIIPIRPIEFFTLKAHDFEEDQSSYYIHIQRSAKSRPGSKAGRKPVQAIP